MSDTVDTRVVEMQFDNKDFEKNVKTSVESLEQLKKSLDLEGAAKGFAEIDKAAKNVDLSSMAASLETISKRFTVTGIIGTDVLHNLTNVAINAAKRIAHSFPPKSVMQGFQEYETQINSVQTILANTSAHFDDLGYTQQERLDVINTKLDELNHYADKTIYNFTQMTRNIGTFTAAGIKLDVAVDSIQGIANLAAVSGSTSQQASTAMYQLSQALASGTVKLMDWNSVVNAGMGGKTFQDALIRTASTMGVVGEDAQEMFAKLKAGQVSFRDSLSSGWLSSDILTETLQQLSWDFEEIAKQNGLAGTTEDLIAMGREIKKTQLLAQGYTESQIEDILNLAQTASDAATKVKTFTQLKDTLMEAMQSGWTQSWEYIIGDFGEAKELWTGFSDFFSRIIEASSDARNAVLKEWHDLGGRDALFNNDPSKGPLGAVWNILYGVQNLVDRVKGKISGLFPSRSDENILLKISKRIQDITGAFYKLTEAPSLSEGLKDLFGNGGLREKLQASFQSVRDSIAEFLERLKIKDLFDEGFDWYELGHSLGFKIGDLIKSIFDSLFQSSDKSLSEIAQSIGKAFGTFFTVTLPNKLRNIGNWFTGAGTSIWQGILEGLSSALSGIWDFVRGFVDGFKEALGIHSPSTVMEEEVGVDMGLGLLAGLAKPFKAIGAWVREHIINPIVNYVNEHNIGEMIKGWFDPEKLKEYWGNVKRVTGVIVSGLRIFFTETIPSFFESHNINMKSMGKSIADSPVGAFADNFIEFLGNVRQGISDGWGKFSSFLSKLFGETIPNILESRGFENLLNFILELRRLTVFSGIFSLGGGLWRIGKGFSGAGKGIKEIASSIGSIASSISSVGTGVGNIGDAIKDVLKKGITIKQKKQTEALGTTILKIAAAVGILAGSLWVLGNMEDDKIVRGLKFLGILAGGLLAVSLAFKAIHVDGKPLLQLAGATLILALSVKTLSKMDWGTMFKGLTGLALIMLELSVFLRNAGKGFTGKTAFIGLAVGIGILVLAMKSIAKLNWDDIGKGLLGIGALLLELGVFMRIGAKGFSNKTAFLGIAIAVNLLVIAVKQISNIDIGKLTKGLLGLGMLFVELGLFMRFGSKGFANKASFLGIAIAVEILVLAVKQIGSMNVGSLIKGLVGIGIMLAMLGDFLKKTSDVSKIAGLVAMAFAVNYLVRAIQKLGRMKTGNLIKGVLALGGVLSAFGFLAKSAKGMNIKGLVTSLILFAGTVGLFLAAFDYTKDSDMDAMLKFATSIGSVILALSASMFLLSKISISGAVQGLGSFAILLAGIGVIAGALGAIDKYFDHGLVDDLNRGAEVFKAVGLSIGNFVGGLTSGFVNTVFDLPQLGNDLSDFMTNVDGFLTGAKKIDSGTSEGIGYLASAIIKIGTAEFMSALAELFVGENPITKFADDMKMLGKALVDYSITIEPLDRVQQSTLNRSVKLAGSLTDVANAIPASGPLISFFNGVGDMQTFSENVGYLGTALVGFSSKVSNIENYDQTKIDAAIALAGGLAELEKNLEEQGGIEDVIHGAKSLYDFGERIGDVIDENGSNSGFAVKLNEFVNEIKKIDFTLGKDDAKINSLLAVASALSELENNLIFRHGMKQGWTGVQSLYDFGTRIGEIVDEHGNKSGFATGLNQFITEVERIDFDYDPNSEDSKKLSAVVEIAKALNELEHTLVFEKGLKQQLAGYQTLAGFGDKLPNFSSGLNAFLTEVRGITYDEASDKGHLDGVIAVATTLNEFEHTLNKQNGVWQWLTGEQSVKAFGDNLIQLGEGLRSFSDNVNAIPPETPTAAVTAMEVVRNFLDDIYGDSNGYQSYTAVVAQPLESITSTMAKIGQNLTSFSEGVNGLDTASTFLTNLIEGIQNGEDSLTIVAINLSNAMTDYETGIGSTYQTWFDVGGYLAGGLSAGINSMAGTVRASATSVAAGAIRSIQMTWSVHSPSKVAEDMAGFFDLGLAGGFTGYSKVVSDAAGNVAKGAVDSAKTMLLADGSSIFDNIDPNPTIRPVLDLTNLQNGVGQIAGMFNSNPMMNAGLFRGFNFSKGVNALNFDGAKILGGQSNSDVLSELEELSDRIDVLADAILNRPLVLDTGALVGGTSDKMDNQLGKLAMRRGRAN